MKLGTGLIALMSPVPNFRIVPIGSHPTTASRPAFAISSMAHPGQFVPVLTGLSLRSICPGRRRGRWDMLGELHAMGEPDERHEENRPVGHVDLPPTQPVP